MTRPSRISSLSRFGRDRMAVRIPSANFSGLAKGKYLLCSNQYILSSKSLHVVPSLPSLFIHSSRSPNFLYPTLEQAKSQYACQTPIADPHHVARPDVHTVHRGLGIVTCPFFETVAFTLVKYESGYENQAAVIPKVFAISSVLRARSTIGRSINCPPNEMEPSPLATASS